MRTARRILIAAACLAGSTGIRAFAEEKRADYLSQVKPLLKKRCFACHGALKQEAGLRLDTAAAILRGGDSGAAVEPGAEESSSVLLERVSETDESLRMPPRHEGEPLKPDEIELLRQWIAAGAPAPDGEKPEADPKDHWSFRRIGRPTAPAVKNSPWVRNPIDAWIAAEHERQGLVPQPETPRIVLLRRLSMDLIGIPPTAEEIAAFEADRSVDWYEKVVDRLLNDARHGERWARHWMDVWRYSDWWGLGDELRNSQRHMWHWRDWIVESLNRDLPYDEMVRLMLAADELAPKDPEKLRATGFLARNYFIFNRTQWMDEVVTHVSKGLLGLTINCSKCHDHKFDPFPQEDFYKMRAFFEPYQVRVDMTPGETDLTKDGIPRVFDGLLEAPTYRYVRGNEASPDTSKVIPPGIPNLLSFDKFSIQSVELPDDAWQPGRRPWVLANHIAAARQRLQVAREKRIRAEQDLQPAKQEVGTAYAPIVDKFAELDPARWKVDGKGWSHQSGRLEQKLDGAVLSTLTLLNEAPRDFEAVLRFQLVGGSHWRSVGLIFDAPRPGAASAGDEPESHQIVYLSAAAEGPKIQGAFTSRGESQYPGEGSKPYAVEVGKEYTLRLRVRGNVINAAVNGEHVLSWRTPLARRSGAVRVTTFDALADIREFRLSALDSAVTLLEPNGAPTLNPREELELAEAELRVAEADLDCIECLDAAVQMQREKADPASQVEKKIVAIRAEQRLAVEKARRDLLLAKRVLNAAADEKRPEAEKKLASAQETLKSATVSLEAAIRPSDEYTLPMGARWSATRFANTGVDDPNVPFPRQSTGRRTALAKWITDRRNPLTARVAVNHLWNRHFGTPLAPTPFDLGRNSPDPAHPELLDWLASELMESGWSMKHLHRLIVTSATYRMSSSLAGGEGNLAADPDNRFWWRRPPIRIESQAVRDSILALAGTLDSTRGGPSVPSGEQAESKRRSLYFFHSNNERNLFLSTFDEAEVGECYRREQSIVPQQALALTNSALVQDSSRRIAERIGGTATGDDEFIRQAFTLVVGIHPGAEEVDASRKALESWKNLPGGTAAQARSNLVWILLNHNDFVTLR
jgi:Protein of unknown function (DUF1553)/Protein of unknown function (DUF1549)/Planctomycete cytochrome C